MGKVYKVSEIRKIVQKDGWYFIGQRGSHEQYKHDIKPGKVTIPNHTRDLTKGTANKILLQAGLKKGGKDES